MKVAIVGSRRRFMKNPEKVKNEVIDFVSRLGPGDVVVSGGESTGVDFWAASAARKFGVGLKEHFANWKRPDGSIDRAAGYKRNRLIERDADECHIFWEAPTPGSQNTRELFNASGKKVTVHEVAPIERHAFFDDGGGDFCRVDQGRGDERYQPCGQPRSAAVHGEGK